MGSSTFFRGRRRTLASLAGLFAAPAAGLPVTHHSSPTTPFAKVVPGYRLQFPRDHASHPDFRVEWWYVTGWLDAGGRELGFQVTFFRARPQAQRDNPSAFAPRQIVLAHAAVSDPAQGRLLHAQRAARAGFGLAGAATERLRVWTDDWELTGEDGAFRARIPAETFALDLAFSATQPPLLQGDGGLSRKGPSPASASYYYSLPHLAARGALTRGGQAQAVSGSAWLDHEWSSQYMEPAAEGWDWIGVNLDDGGALMAFRMRGRDGSAVWAGGSLRAPDGRARTFAPGEVRFIPGRRWTSNRTGTAYPVTWRVEAAGRAFDVEPLFDDQEHDARASSGTIYWEGAVRVRMDGRPAGRGYLELTGYWRRLEL